jgi:hypothetical protein
MKLGRILLGVAAAILFTAAAFHASGAAQAASWAQGTRGEILRLLWAVPTIDWAVVGIIWLAIAWYDDRRLAPLVWISACIPVLVAVLLVKAVGIAFPGSWLLAAAALLAVVGATRLGQAEPSATT